MKTARDDFSETTKRRLAERVAYRCSNSSCGKATTGPHSNHEKSIRIGRAAHIFAAAPGGPRYAPKQSRTERSSIHNAIWLCANCADLIDKDAASFSVERLFKWKSEAEAVALKELKSSSSSSFFVSAQLRLRVSKLLYEAFDLLAGAEAAKRITATRPESRTLERVRRIIEECEILAPSLEKVIWLKACYLLALDEVERAYDLSLSCPNSGEPDRLLIQSQCLHKLGRAKEAIPLLLEVAETKDLEATAYYNLGLAHDDCDERSMAKAYYERALVADPVYAYPHSRLAKIAYESGNLDVAERHSQVACDLEPNDPVLWFRLSLVLLDQGQVNDALNVLQVALDRFPTDSDLNGMRGRALGQIGLIREAETALRHSITLDSKNGTSWYNLGFLLMLEGRLNESMAAMQQAIEHGYPNKYQVECFIELLTQLPLGEGYEREDIG